MANEFFDNEYTEVLQKLVNEVVNDPKTYLGAKYLPSTQVHASRVRVEVIEATGGYTNEHVPGTEPKVIKGGGSRVQEFIPPAYKETIIYDEPKLLYLRELGQNDRSKRGVRKYIDRDIDKLNRRIEARIELQRWKTIFDGGYSFMGRNISFGIPAGNRAVPVGALWSLDGVSANASANPVSDIRYWLQGGLAAFRKYVVTKMVMNPNTARWILDNANTKAYATSYAANPNITSMDVNKVLQFLIPGLPEVEVYNGWYQEETIVSQKVTVGDAIYMVPDGYIFFEVSLPGNDVIGEFCQTLNLSSGTIDDPGVGKFLVIEDNTAPGSKGGLTNPFINLVGGTYGGAKLDRAFDVLTAKVIA